MTYERKDYYYKKAKLEGKPSRAAYKIEAIQKRFKLIKKGDVVIDLGCAPGGWLKEISKFAGSNGTVVGVDSEAIRIEIPKNCIFILGDVMAPEAINQLCLSLTKDADVIVSDMAPHTSGINFSDSYKSYTLAMRALEICSGILKEGGNFVVKIFQGKEFDDFKKSVARTFKKVAIIIPPATRKASKEIYLVGIGRKKTPINGVFYRERRWGI